MFQKGDSLVIEAGKMTHIDNVYYCLDKNGIVKPGHIYRVGLEIPEGTYIYKFDKRYYTKDISFCKSEECAFDKHINYANSSFHRDTGEYGYVMVYTDTRHIRIHNGIAAFYGDNKFDEEKIVRDCSIQESVFFNDGISIFSSPILEIRLYQKKCTRGRFMGEIPMDVLNYYIYTVGDKLKWMADVNPLSFQNPQSMSICFSETTNKANKHIETISNFAYHYDRDNDIKWFHVYAFLPNSLKGKDIAIELNEYNGKSISGNYIDYEEHDGYADVETRNLYKKDFDELENLLKNFEGLDIGNELLYFEKAPDLLDDVNKCLRDVVAKKKIFENQNQEDDTEITFSVEATYNKKFYCIAKIADDAHRLQVNDDNSVYKVTFRSSQISQIELMSYLLFDINKIDEVKNRNYLNQRSYIFYTISNIQNTINRLNDIYGYSSVVTNSVLVRIIKLMNRKLQQRVDDLYSQISKEGRVQAKWGNEYHLFMIVSKYVKDTYYQYHCEWLGKQSYDIYLEKYKTAIEYQGQQHYEAIDLFGGEEGLKYNQERDQRKRMLSEAHGVRLLEWKYTIPVEEKEVINFLNHNGIEIDVSTMDSRHETNVAHDIDMAPIKPKFDKHNVVKQKKTIESRVKSYIAKYSLDGKLEDRYVTIGEAAHDVGISPTSISKVIRGERNTAGGFVWRKFSSLEEISEMITISFDVKLTNDGMAKGIAKIDDKGNILEEYPSIMEAAKKNKVEYKSIQKKIKKGDGWTYL